VDVPPFVVSAEHPIARTAMHAAATLGKGGAIATRTTWFDGATPTRSGTPSVALDPGSIDDAHTIDEHIELDELVRACQVLALAAMGFCGVADEAPARC
jgi:acetylornithine deacetylase/succinyl-diaminopimelate desuccinylase-like protein